MSGPVLFAIGMAIGFALGGANLYLAHRRRKTFAKVQGLYLEATTPSVIQSLGTPWPIDTRGAYDRVGEHVCTFKPCPHLEREAQRRATAIRLNGGPAA